MTKVKNKFPLIAIEGIDGAGKTTVAKLLAEEINGVYYKTPSQKFSQCRMLFEGNSRRSLSRFLFYASILWAAWDEIKNALQTKPVVVDRYILSTKIYHEALLKDQPELKNKIEESFYNICPPLPDYNFVLKVEPEIAESRLKRSNKGKLFDSEIEQDRKLQDKIAERFYQHGDNVYLIDAQNNSEEQIVNECKKIISLFGKN